MRGKVTTPKAKLWKAIKEHCTDCSGGSIKERQLCPVESCPLHPYRNGLVRNRCNTGMQDSEENGE